MRYHERAVCLRNNGRAVRDLRNLPGAHRRLVKNSGINRAAVNNIRPIRDPMRPAPATIARHGRVRRHAHDLIPDAELRARAVNRRNRRVVRGNRSPGLRVAGIAPPAKQDDNIPRLRRVPSGVKCERNIAPVPGRTDLGSPS